MIVAKKIKPMFSRIVTTMEKYGVDEVKGVLIDPSKMAGAIKEVQKVVAVGTTVTDIKEGDYVKINPMKYAVYKDKRDAEGSNSVIKDIPEHNKEIIGFNIPRVEMEDQEYLMLATTDIEYIITEYEEEKPDSGLIHTEPKLIV